MKFLLCGKYSRQWDDAVQAARIHPAFIPVTGLKCSYGQKFLKHSTRSRLEKRRSLEPSQPAFSYEHIENFIKVEISQNQLGQPGSCEAAVRISSCGLKCARVVEL